LLGCPVLAPADCEIVPRDFEKGKCVVSVILRLKTDYIRKLPWLLHGLACTDMPRARQVAAQALETWEQDPILEAHHRVTVSFMCNPGLVSDLRRFSDGCSSEECSVDFQLEVAKRRFSSCVETTIEEKHARVSKSQKGYIELAACECHCPTGCRCWSDGSLSVECT